MSEEVALSKETRDLHRNCANILRVFCNKNSSSKLLGSQGYELPIWTQGLSKNSSVVFIPNLKEILFFDPVRLAPFSLVQFIILLIYNQAYVLPLRSQRPLEHWDCGFDCHSRHGCLCAFVLCLCFLCIGSGLATGLSPIQEVIPTEYRLRNWKSGQGPQGL
jgi:hypothetical protein